MVLVTCASCVFCSLLLILFVTSETWRYVGQLDGVRVIPLALATCSAAVLVVGLGLRRTLDPSIVRRATVRITVETIAFGALLFATLVVVGVVSVDADLVAEWSGSDAGVLVSLSIGGPPNGTVGAAGGDRGVGDGLTGSPLVTRWGGEG